MNSEHIKYLIRKYNENSLSKEEELDLEKGIEMGFIQLEDLEEIQLLSNQLDHYFSDHLSRQMQDNFYTYLSDVESQQSWWTTISTWWADIWATKPILQLAYSALLVFLGVGLASWWLSEPGKHQDQVAALSHQVQEIQQMQEQIMLELIDKESTTERLKAVNLTEEMDHVSEKVAKALLHTLNFDHNGNVRLAALRVLRNYADNPEVRKGLVNSILHQDDPFVQMALGEVMEAWKEKSSLEYLEVIIKKKETPEVVKINLKKNMQQLL